MTVMMEEEVTPPFDFDWKTLAEKVILFSLDYERFPYEAEVNLILTDNDSIREINRLHRDMDRPTDVLSFPMLNFASAGDFTGIE